MDPDQGFHFHFISLFFIIYISELREEDRFLESREGEKGARRGAELDERAVKRKRELLFYFKICFWEGGSFRCAEPERLYNCWITRTSTLYHSEGMGFFLLAFGFPDRRRKGDSDEVRRVGGLFLYFLTIWGKKRMIGLRVLV